MLEDEGMGQLMAALMGLLVVGGPMVLYVWHELSEALSGRISPDRLALSGVFLVLLVVMLRGFGRLLLRLDPSVE